jgi:hypothetical protein
MIDRRRFLLSGTVGATACVVSLTSHAQSEGWEPFDEDQQGDARLPAERIKVNPATVARLSSGEVRAEFKPRDAAFLTNLLAAADKHVGNSRKDTRERIAEYLDIFDLPFSVENKPVPFCAAGVVYAAAQHYAQLYKIKAKVSGLRSVLAEIDRYHFYPSPSVWDMVNVAKGKRKWKAFNSKLAPKPGWLVVFDWRKRGNADHVGIVVSQSGTTLNTIEFNTSDDNPSNGGRVARKKRSFDGSILGFIATDLRPPFERT